MCYLYMRRRVRNDKVTELRLNPFIYYRIYMDKLFLFDTKHKKVYQFNDSAADMIDIVGKKPNVLYADFINRCMEIYDVSQEQLENDANEFLHMLYSMNILSDTDLFEPSVRQEHISDNSHDLGIDVEKNMLMLVGENKILSKALLELTYKCNLKCIHCYAIGSHSKCQDMKTEDWFSILDQLSSANVLNITFTGGEVFCRDDFLAILDYAIEKRFLVDIYSNGTMISDEQISHLAAYWINSFQVSLYGDTPDLHDSITGVEGSFNKTLATLRMFKDYGISLTIKTIMMNKNADSCAGMKKIADDLGATFQIGLSISQANNGDISPTAHRIQSTHKMKNIILERDKELINEVPPGKDLNESLCGAGFNGISINPCGWIYICNAIDIRIGDYQNERIIDVWTNSSKLHDFRAKRVSDTKKCVKCNYIDYCQFCPGVALQDAGALTEAYDEACFIAKLRYEVLKK